MTKNITSLGDYQLQPVYQDITYSASEPMKKLFLNDVNMFLDDFDDELPTDLLGKMTAEKGKEETLK